MSKIKMGEAVYETDDLVKRLHIRKLLGAKMFALLVKSKGGFNESMKNINKLSNAIASKYVPDSENTYRVFFSLERKSEIKGLCEGYYNSGLFDFVEPDIKRDLNLCSPIQFNDTLFNKQWYWKSDTSVVKNHRIDSRISDALNFIIGKNINVSKDIIIAVLDEGVDSTHEDFVGREIFKKNFSVIGGSVLPISNRHHGTQMTGIIVAIQNNQKGITGINPYCKIMAGKIYADGTNNRYSIEKIGIGIRKAVDRGARIINLSWGISHYSRIIADSIRYATQNDVLVCAAAGNYSQNKNSTILFPASMDEVIGIGAHNSSGDWINLTNTPRKFKFGSCYGRGLDILAPGIFIPTTKNNNQYGKQEYGTSISTAIVSAIAGLILAVNPLLPASKVKEVLFSTTDKINDQELNMNYFNHYGHGRINAYNAVKKAYSIK